MRRCVRRIVAFAVFAVCLVVVIVGRASAPSSRYAITATTVYDTKTKLTWQRAISASTYTQPDAVAYCAALGSNSVATWRLPTMKELLTIVDLSVPPPGPTIDTAAFPGSPNGYFWSVTPYTGTPGSAWSVLFMYGFSYGNTMTDASYARCVR